MSRVIRILLTAIAVLMLAGCATYTVGSGLAVIQIPEEGDLIETRYNEIEKAVAEAAKKAADEAEAKRLQAEAEAAAAEAAKVERDEKAKAQEELIRSLSDLRNRNDFPQDLSSLTFPHIFRPVGTDEVLSSTFTRVDTLLLPLGEKTYSTDEIAHIASSIKDIKVQLLFVTGSLENQVAVANALQRNAVALEGGMVIFTPEIISASADSALFSLAEGKEVGVSVLGISDSMIRSDNPDIPAWQEYLSEKSDEDIARVEKAISDISSDSKLFALSSSEPSSEDWTIFTPYSYRSEYSWPISDLLSESWSDTYRATHFSEETDAGITLKTPYISERLDFMYTQGVMEISSETIPAGILSDGEDAVFALYATYIIP